MKEIELVPINPEGDLNKLPCEMKFYIFDAFSKHNFFALNCTSKEFNAIVSSTPTFKSNQKKYIHDLEKCLKKIDHIMKDHFYDGILECSPKKLLLDYLKVRSELEKLGPKNVEDFLISWNELCKNVELVLSIRCGYSFDSDLSWISRFEIENDKQQSFIFTRFFKRINDVVALKILKSSTMFIQRIYP